MINYFTDGSTSPNPGPGGFAVIKNKQGYLIGGEPTGSPVNSAKTTNIRMEGWAIVTALRDANNQECTITTDSEFWINVLTKWAPNWAKNNWQKKTGEIKNLDIVQIAYNLYRKSQSQLIWTRGHAGNEFNELADRLANKARELQLTDPISASNL